MINNDTNTSIRLIAWMSFLSGREFMKTFGISHTRRERVNFNHRLWNARIKIALQSFWINSSIPSNRICFGFSQVRKISARIRCWTHRTTVGLLWPRKLNWLWWKRNTQSPSKCLGRSLATMKLCVHSSFHMVPTHQVRWSREWLLEDPTSDCRTLRYTVQSRKPILDCEKSSSPLTFSKLSRLQSSRFLCVGWNWVRGKQNFLQHQRWTGGKDDGSIYQFKQGERRKSWRGISKLSVGHG